MNITYQKVKRADGTMTYRVIIPIEEQVFFGIRQNTTPRKERNYPIRVGKKY